MIRQIVERSLRLRVLVTIVAAGIVLAGVIQLRNAPVDIHPEFKPTYVEIQTEALGLSAHEVEQLITVPMEADLLNGVAWLSDIRSESVAGLSSIVLVFESGTPLYKARQVVQERIAQAAIALPAVSKPPRMLQPVSSTSRTMMIGLSSKTLSLIDISQLARWTIKPRLMGLEGVANVSTFGQRERELQVRVNPQRLADNKIALLDVVETTGNAVFASPLTFLEASTPGTGGFIETPTERLGIHHVNPIVGAADLAKVTLADHGELRLGDVADVVEDHQPLIGDALLNKGRGIAMVVEKLPGANTVDVTKRVEAALDDLAPALKGLDMDRTLFRPADYVTSARHNVGVGALAALALVVALLALVFYQWRLALVSVATILVSLVAACLVLYLRGESFNSMVLAGLAVAIGVVVDDAVTGAERIARRRSEAPERPPEANILAATVQVRGTIAYALVFALLPIVPVFFMGEIFGFFGRHFAISYAVAVAVSMAVAVVFTPALSMVLLRNAPAPGRRLAALTRLEGRYESLLSRLLGLKRPALIFALALAAVGAVTVPQLSQSELPGLKERDFLVELEAAPGTSLQRMKQLTSDVAGELRATDGVRTVTAQVGRAVTSDRVSNVNQSDVWVSLDPDAPYGRTVAALKRVVAAHPSLGHDVLTYTQSRLKEAESGADAPIVVRVLGNESAKLTTLAEQVGAKLEAIDGIDHLQVETPVEEPTLEVEVDLERAKQFGIKPGDVRRTAAYLLASVVVGQVYYDQKVFDVVIWGDPQIRQSETDVRNLLIDTPDGKQVRLEEVADVRRVNSPSVVEREGAFRRIDVSASVAGRTRAAVVRDVKEAIKEMDFPLEFRAEFLGTYDDKRAAEGRLLRLGALVALGMLLLLQACFGS
ncbi:MAG: hypothetical protein QOF21_310, partial [Actinomycetota bacterium]